MRLSNTIVLASMNPDKYREFKALLTGYPDIELLPAEGIIRNPDKIEFAEHYSTYTENAAAKARLANQASHYPCLADDSGLEIDALEGKPGVRSRRYAKLAGVPSRINQDRANIDLVLSELKKKTDAPRTARFVTTLALVLEGISVTATGILDGTIADSARGEMGFGYDPIFIPKGFNKTLGEMTQAEKNSISHRARAIHEIIAQVRARGIVLAKP